MTPFQLGLVTGGVLGFVVAVIIMGVLFIVSRPRYREIGRDEIARMRQ